MGVLPGAKPTGPALKAASVAGGPAVSAASSAEQHRRQIDKIKAKRPPAAAAPAQPATATAPATTSATAPTVPPPASPGGGPSLPSVPMPAAAATGSGFLLGLFGWALGLAYLRGGAPEMRRFLAAKFLNQTTTGG